MEKETSTILGVIKQMSCLDFWRKWKEPIYQDEKFRLKVVEKNDGSIMYFPQIYCVVKVKFLLFERVRLDYGWRGLHQTKNGIDVCLDELKEQFWIWLQDEKDKDYEGCGSSDKKSAEEMIEQYKKATVTRAETKSAYNKQKFNSETKKVDYIMV